LSALVLFGGVALAQQGGPHPTDTLRVSDDPSRALTPTAAPSTPAPGATPSPGGAAPSASPSSAPEPVATTSPSPAPRGPRVGVYRTPDLTRAYVDRTKPGGLTVCPSSSSDGSSVAVDWCESAVARPTSRGHDLVAEVCRDASADGQLSFGSTHEVELRVQDAGGRTVWTWSAGHLDEKYPHVLAVQRNHCWDWTAPWTDVDARGVLLPQGTYQLVVAPLARELSAAPEAMASFTV